MLMLVLAPTFTFHDFATLVAIIAAGAVLFWLIRKVGIPEPFNFVLYAVLALLAIWLIFWGLGRFG
jgi:hypothetical protein